MRRLRWVAVSFLMTALIGLTAAAWLVSGTMYLLVRLTAAAIPGNDLVRLLAELATGVVSYLALSALFRLEAFREVTAIVRRPLKK